MLSGQGVNTYKISTIVDKCTTRIWNRQGVNTYKISTIVDEFEKALFLGYHYHFPERLDGEENLSSR